MPTALMKYASNQMDVATVKSPATMTALLDSAHLGFTAANNANSLFTPALGEVNDARLTWTYATSAIVNTLAYQRSRTPLLEAKFASLTHKPDMENQSILDRWVKAIVNVTPEGSSLYLLLLPDGRETLTVGTINERIDALQNFVIRLGEQTAHPPLQTLASADVSVFAGQVEAIREAQELAKASVAELRGQLEPKRKAAAAALYSAIGRAMSIYKLTPERVDELFDINILRGSGQEIPGAPVDTAWDPATRTLSTTEMPADATHVVAFRQGEGAAPEQLATGETDEMTVGIPSSFTFDPGESYDLWLQGKNAKGLGPKGPVVVWVAP